MGCPKEYMSNFYDVLAVSGISIIKFGFHISMEDTMVHNLDIALLKETTFGNAITNLYCDEDDHP